jgi:peroxiredoxin
MINKDQPALDFEMSDVQGRTIRLSDYRGKRNIVLVFLRGFM